jgi:hypothetical protein
MEKLIKNIADRVYRHNVKLNNGIATDKSLIRSVIEAGGYDPETVTDGQKTEIFNTVIAKQSAPTAIVITPPPASTLSKHEAVGIVFQSLETMAINLPMNQISTIAQQMIEMQLSSIDAVNYATEIINTFIAEGERRFNESLQSSLSGIATEILNSNDRINNSLDTAFSSMEAELTAVNTDYKSRLAGFKQHITQSFKN